MNIPVDEKIWDMALEMLSNSFVTEKVHARDAAYDLNIHATWGPDTVKHLKAGDRYAEQGKKAQAKAEYNKAIKIFEDAKKEAEKIPDDDFSDWGLRILHTLNIFRPKDHVFDTISDISRSGGHVKDVTRATIIKRIDEMVDLAQKEMNSL